MSEATPPLPLHDVKAHNGTNLPLSYIHVSSEKYIKHKLSK